MQTSITTRAGYMDEAFEPDLSTLVEKFIDTAGHLKFDTLIGTGLSGTLVVPHIARALGLKWAIVRKDDGAHSSNPFEGELGQRWLFVDDFVSSGATLQRVQDKILAFVDKHNTQIDTRIRFAKDWNDVAEIKALEEKRFFTQYVGTYQYSWDRMYSP